MNLTFTPPPPFLSGYGTTSIKPILNSFMKIIITLKLLFLIAVIDFFSGGGGDAKEIASFRVVCLGFSVPFSLCFLCCFVLEQGMV